MNKALKTLPVLLISAPLFFLTACSTMEDGESKLIAVHLPKDADPGKESTGSEDPMGDTVIEDPKNN